MQFENYKVSDLQSRNQGENQGIYLTDIEERAEKEILTSCPTKNFCSIPGVGEFCVLGTNQANKLTQFKATVEPELTGGQNKLNSFEFILLLLLMILLFLVICLVCSTYYEFKRYKERRKIEKACPYSYAQPYEEYLHQ